MLDGVHAVVAPESDGLVLILALPPVGRVSWGKGLSPSGGSSLPSPASGASEGTCRV